MSCVAGGSSKRDRATASSSLQRMPIPERFWMRSPCRGSTPIGSDRQPAPRASGTWTARNRSLLPQVADRVLGRKGRRQTNVGTYPKTRFLTTLIAAPSCSTHSLAPGGATSQRWARNPCLVTCARRWRVSARRSTRRGRWGWPALVVDTFSSVRYFARRAKISVVIITLKVAMPTAWGRRFTFTAFR